MLVYNSPFLQDVDLTAVVGPLWTGPLHDASFLTEMRSLADEWGWAYTSENGVTLEKLLSMMIEESDPRLPPGYIRLDEVCLAVLCAIIDFLEVFHKGCE
jgi:tRNA G26 N,N-dimethylase Trm1